MPDDDFKYDVFLSHSSRDKAVVRPLAERLRADGLRVWLDDWELKPSDNIPHKIEEGLEHSRILLLRMSANAFGSDWAQLESQMSKRLAGGEWEPSDSTVALAGQISREFSVSDRGIDMKIEFKSDGGEPTGRRLYFKEERWARYWMGQAFPVLLVVRNSEGEVRWMEVRDWLKRASDGGRKPVKQIAFEGERFDVMSVRRWRERVLGRGGN